MKVKMLPHLSWFESGESGIHSVVRAYFKYLPEYGIELVDPKAKDYDLLAIHAGSLDVAPPKDKPIVSHLHGMYWTADYDAHKSEYEANRRIANILHYAKEVTVPAAWVGEVLQRDMRFSPHILPHGIDWQDWQHKEPDDGYVLAYAKNRVGDVCDNSFLPHLAKQFPDTLFLTTFVPSGSPDNVVSLREYTGSSGNGVIPHKQLKKIIQRARVVMSPIKETFGILTLEAMAAGKTILGLNKGGNVDLIQHGVNGYLYDTDIADGLDYCLQHTTVLGDNGREIAKSYTWQKVCEQLSDIYRWAMGVEVSTVGVVIPVYNKPPEQVKRAIDSCLNQTLKPKHIVLVNDGSSQNYNYFADHYVYVVNQENQGVATARNNGIAELDTKYVCCLDADDWLDPTFLEVCVNALENDNSLALAYTGLTSHEPDGKVELSPGNPHWDYDRMLNGQNSVWTCNVFRREVWQRLGGYRSRYCPNGAGEEDAELWLRMGAYGYKAEKVTDEGLFHYSWKTGLVSGNNQHRMTDYRAWHPWVEDNHHPLASYAMPINKVSHSVRQYDEPLVSVIIPVGPGHETIVADALDSLEAQRMRKWEAIVVDDTGYGNSQSEWLSIYKSYPYVKFFTLTSESPKGTGYARNRGVEIARAPLILFLDADDTLKPIDALEKMVDYWNTYQAAIYTDYVGQAHLDEEAVIKLGNKIESYNPRTNEAIILYQRNEFDCKKALREPTTLETAYNWNVVTTLLPKAWHNEVGGFDESMETLEDWDYWLRIAKAGHCFKHLPESLVRYRLRAGERHIDLDEADGRQKAILMLEYIKKKNIQVIDMGCGCAKDKQQSIEMAVASTMNDNDFVKAVYTGRRGNHHIVGPYEFAVQPSVPFRKSGNGFKIYYGYADQGYETLVHKSDLALMPGKWQIKPEIVQPKTEMRSALPNPTLIDTLTPMQKLEQAKQAAKAQISEFDLTKLSAVTPAIAKRMTEAGYDTPFKIKQAGVEGLIKIKGIAEARAQAILSEL